MKDIKFDQKNNLGENFMDSNLNSFKEKFDPYSIDQKGRAISPDELDPVGIKPAMNPAMAVPTSTNNSIESDDLYSSGMAKVKIPKKSGTYNDKNYGKKNNDATYGIKATTRPKITLKK